MDDMHDTLINRYWQCMICGGPDLLPHQHVECVKDGVIDSVICERCWNAMDEDEQDGWVDFFDSVYIN